MGALRLEPEAGHAAGLKAAAVKSPRPAAEGFFVCSGFSLPADLESGGTATTAAATGRSGVTARDKLDPQ